MTSKELVPLNGKATLAVIEDRAPLIVIDENSPCPRFDRRVKTIAVEIWELAHNRNVFPGDRQTEREHFEYTLRKLVNDVEAGEWTETLPELLPSDGDPTQVLRGQKSVLDLTADEFEERWDLMTRTEKLSWIMEVTDK